MADPIEVSDLKTLKAELLRHEIRSESATADLREIELAIKRDQERDRMVRGRESPSPLRAPFEARNGCIQAKNRRGCEILPFWVRKARLLPFAFPLIATGTPKGADGGRSSVSPRCVLSAR